MKLTYKGIDVFYTDTGSGAAVVLLHGFLEDHSMWDDIASRLVKTHRVITVDLPGHGQTGCLGEVHTMTDMADVVRFVLESLQLTKVILVGHSMGGYVALAFAKQYPNDILGLCLMNSTCEADDDERKALRAKANMMIKDNFVSMVRVSFANLFSELSKVQFRSEFESALNIALQTPVEGYIAGQEGMRLREDTTSFFVNAPFKKRIILGEKDAVLDSEALFAWAQKHDIPVDMFGEGHMSHIENKTECENSIVHFIENI